MRPIILAFPLLCAACITEPALAPGSLVLSNPDSGPTRVETKLTTSGICLGPGLTPQIFVMPHDATRFVEAPAGTDVCWRKMVAFRHRKGAHWSNWNLAYTYPGRAIASRL